MLLVFIYKTSDQLVDVMRIDLLLMGIFGISLVSNGVVHEMITLQVNNSNYHINTVG